jgi:hypothetical protein
MVSKRVNTKIKIGFNTEWEEMFVFVEINHIKYFVSQNPTLLKVPCARRMQLASSIVVTPAI